MAGGRPSPLRRGCEPIRRLRPACGTVSNAQLLTLPEIIRIIAPGEVTTQLSHPPPASSSATDVFGSSERRLATAQPPEPPPTTTKSNVSVMRILPFSLATRLGFRGTSGKGASRGAWRGKYRVLTVIKPRKESLAALSKAHRRWYIPLAPRGLVPGCLVRKPPDGIGASGVGQIRFGFREGEHWLSE